jgi:hypothetical protein
LLSPSFTQDIANVPVEVQEAILNQARQNLQRFNDKLVWLRNFTSVAVKEIKEPLDYVYVDARHDYCGAMEDISLYWPLIRPGGIMAGHDYENAADVMKKSGQDWALCMNGTRMESAVLGAVNDFFGKEGLQVVVTYREADWNSWMVRKPLSTTVRAAGDHGVFATCPKPVIRRFDLDRGSTSSSSSSTGGSLVARASGSAELDSSSSSGSSVALDGSPEELTRLLTYLASQGAAAGLSKSRESDEKLAGTATMLLLGSAVWALTGLLVLMALFLSCVRPKMVELPGGWLLTTKGGAQKLAKEAV